MKPHQDSVKHLTLFIINSFFSCLAAGYAVATPNQIITAQSVSTSRNRDTLAVAGVKSLIPVGAVLGIRQCSSGTFFIKTRCGENVSGGMSDDFSQSIRRMIEADIQSAVLKQPISSVFFGNERLEPSQNPQSSSRYLLGVTITGAKVDSLQSMSFIGTFSWKTVGSIATKWEVLDTKTRTIIIAEEIRVEKIDVPGDNIRAAILNGVNSALKSFVSSQRFQEFRNRYIVGGAGRL